MKENNKDDLLHHSIIYKILSSLLYLIAYPVLFLVTKFWLGLKIEGRENLDKVGDEYIAVANHINMIDCAMIALSIFPRVPYFLTLQSNLEIPFIKYLVMLFRGIPIPRKITGKEKMIKTIDKLFTYREVNDIRKFIRKKPFITLTILEPEYPKDVLSKENVIELKARVYKKMTLERRMKKLYDEQVEENAEMQEEKI